MNEACILDASAILTVVFAEPGAEMVVPLLALAKVSAVNQAEVVGKMLDRGWDRERVPEALKAFPYEVVALDEDLGLETGLLRAATKSHGLSLGDRACVALASRLRLPILTADRTWAKLPLPVEIRLTR